jgi:spore maturation protein CgeB
MKVLLVGDRGGTNIADCFERIAPSLRLDTQLLESRTAIEAPIWLKRFNWWIRDRRPTYLRRFSYRAVEICRQWKPQIILTTGIAPINKDALQEIGQMGVRRINYLTDDPWNIAHRSKWFLSALPCYDQIFNPRRSNITDLKQLGCKDVRYLPFGYAPDLHYKEQFTSSEESKQFSTDVVFLGGADKDRIPYLSALAKKGFNIGLYGGYWERFNDLKPLTRGHADVTTMRKAIAGTKVALCLVRRANRDGHAMRTYEVPAVGACMLLEDTDEHRDLFGEEGNAVVYFTQIDEMIEKTRWLLDHDTERERMAQVAHELITKGKNTYQDRLKTMLGLT